MYNGSGGRGRGRSNFDDNTPKPVKVGDELDVTIEAVAARGDGLAKKDGFVIFINGAKMGDSVHVKITEVKQRYATGQIMGGASAPAEAPAAEAPSEAIAQE